MNGKKQELIKAIAELPEGKRKVLIWLIKHHQFAVEMCEEGPLTEEQSADFERDAIERNDDYLLVLVLLERIINAKKIAQRRYENGAKIKQAGSIFLPAYGFTHFLLKTSAKRRRESEG